MLQWARDPFAIGIAAGVVGALVAGLIGLASVTSFGTTQYTAMLQHTSGLIPGQTVRVSGVTVGEVTEVRIEGQAIAVEFVMDSDIHLGSRTSAAVKVATLLGTHYLAVDPAGGGSLENGTIPLARTTVPFDLQEVLNEGTRQLDKLDAAQLAESLTTLARTLSASGDEIGPALRGVARLSDLVAKRSAQVGRLLEAATRVSTQLSRDSKAITALMEKTTLVMSEVTERREAIDRLLTETTRLADSLTAIVNKTKEDVRPALRDLNRILDTLRQEKETLSHVLELMAPAVRYIANATGNGPWAEMNVHDPAVPPDDLRCLLGNCS